MTFTQSLENFNILRRRLATIDSEIKINEILINIPKSNNDELSFLRLVAWSYVFIYENAKVHVKFFNALNGSKLDPPYIRALRTYMAHNLSFDSKSDMKVIKEAQLWFKKICGTINPDSTEEWEKCFIELVIEVNTLITHLIQLCNQLEDTPDSSDNLLEFKKRIQKNWDAYLFDSYISRAIVSLGYSGISEVEFRTIHLNNWRKIVETADEDKVDRLLTQRIEADLIAHMSQALPFTLDELKDLLSLTTPEELQSFIVLIRQEVEPGKPLSENLTSIATKSLS